MHRIGMRGALRPLLAVFVAALAASCGELTGPESPSTPSNVVAVLEGATSVRVTWTPSPLSDGVISYSVFRNGTKVGESTTNDFLDTGLSPQTTYVYSVAANCKSGIVSDRSVENEQSTVTTLDITPPTVVSVQPPENFVGVSPAATVTVTFSEPMDPATINGTNITLRITSSGQAIAGTVTYNATTRVATLTPSATLPNPVNFTATVSTGVRDLGGNALAAAKVWTFTTRDDTPPTVLSTSPTNGATGVSPTAVVTATFSEAMNASTITAANFTLRVTSSGAAVAGTVTYNASTNTATFTPSAPLAQSVNFTASLSTAIRDVAGNALGAVSFSFTTGDVTAPTVTSTVPANNATGVSPTAPITATFSEAMDPTTINTTTFTVRLTSGVTPLAGTVTYNAGTNTATFTPSVPLLSSTSYTATITTGVRDAAGNAMAAAHVWTFTTADVVAPTVTAVLPLDGATNVSLNTTVQVTFSEPMNATTINTTTFTLRPTASATPVGASVLYNPATNVATLTPSAPLTGGTSYTVTVTTGAQDAGGNGLASNFTSTFTTLVPDVTPPTVTGVVPANLATGVATNTTAQVTFSEAMNATTINTTNLFIRNTGTLAVVPATVSYNAGTNVATIAPTGPLSNLTNYTIVVTTGVEDVAGNPMASPFMSSFTTQPVPDVTPPTVIARTPAAGATNVAVNTNITVTFSEAMDPATITTSTVTLALTSGGPAVAAVVTYDAGTNTATLNPNADLLNDTSYTITVTTGVRDVAQNPMAAPSVSTFRTIPDTTPPTVILTSPVAGASNVNVNSTVTVTFSENMDPATINGSTFSLQTTVGMTPVPGIVSYNAATRVATFTPSAPLTPGINYTATVTTGARDLAGNPLVSQVTFTFTTAGGGP